MSKNWIAPSIVIATLIFWTLVLWLATLASAQELDPRQEAFRGTYTNAPTSKPYGSGVVITYPKVADPTEKYRNWRQLRMTRLQELGKQIALTINFEFDSFDLEPDAKVALDKLIVLLNENPDIGLIVEGHTDLVGTDDYNDTLSLLRANAIEVYLSTHEVDLNRFFTKARGEHFPIFQTEDKNRPNRRVEIALTDLFIIKAD